jgi:MFS family permease
VRLIAGRVGPLGVAQIVSWGTLFYSIAVLAAPMSARIGASEEAVYFAFSLSLAVSALAAPTVGKAVDRHGGGLVMTAGSVVAAAAFVVLAVAEHLVLFATGWALAGVAMAMTLYDAAFATLHQRWPARYRGAVSALSLLGGLASTVAWPATLALDHRLGLRGTLVAFALLHLVVALPIHALFLGGTGSAHRPADHTNDLDPELARRLGWLSLAFALSTFVLTGIVAHLTTLLGPFGYSRSTIVQVGMLFGPAQVAARAVEWLLARRISALRAAFTAFALLVSATSTLALLDGGLASALCFALLLGSASGLSTLSRGTAPALLARGAPIGAALGRIARATLFARAVAPLGLASILEVHLAPSTTPAALVAISVGAAASYGRAVRACPPSEKAHAL